MCKIRVRAIVGIMIFLGYFLVYVVRYNLSVHIVDMVEIPKHLFNIFANDETQSLRSVLKSRSGNYDIMHWNELKMALLLAAYHIGYCICFPIFHNIGDKFGPMWVVGATGFTSGVLNCLTPACAYSNFWLLFTVRILIGFCAGAMIPSMIQVLRHWVPPTERHHFMWAYCGITTGTFSTFLICAAVQYYFGWSVGFYISGSVQVLWACIWVLVISDSPSKHAFISKEELSYLTTTIGTVFNIKLTNSQVPWKLILKSATFWALCILNFGYAWMITSVCLHCPLYYTTILKYSIYEASALVALPFFLRLILGTIIIQTYHWYKYNKKIKRIKHIRKYFIVVSHVISGFLVSMAWVVPINPGPVLLTAAIVLTAAGMDLTLDICYSLSPNYVNPINTVIKIIGNLPGIIVSLCVGEVTYKYQNTALVWHYVWSFHGTMIMLSGLVFLIWGDFHVQPWNEIRRRPRKKRLVTVRSSAMSNITELDEDDSLNRIPISQRQNNTVRLS
ncbi:sialin-like [Pararge aegeria]|uniref:sialin-like n=1 Tax=Pararge aegeria TaxID=116150 RepID=UPI0019D15AA7|nr:sialin-like [Pararge aegeria]